MHYRTGLVGVLKIDLLDQHLVTGQASSSAFGPEREIGPAKDDRPTWAYTNSRHMPKQLPPPAMPLKTAL